MRKAADPPTPRLRYAPALQTVRRHSAYGLTVEGLVCDERLAPIRFISMSRQQRTYI